MKKYKIFDYPWHIPHQFDMATALNEDCDFYMCLTTKKRWDETQRPIPDNVSFVTHYEPEKYDVAILHIDQSCILASSLKTTIFNQFDEVITDIPKIIINHGTPVFPEGFDLMGYPPSSSDQREKDCVNIIKSIVRERPMVVNSHTSATQQEWGFGIPIVHGMNASNWFDAPKKEPRAFTALSPYGFDTYYNRKCMIATYEELLNVYGYPLAYAKLNIDTDRSPERYKDYLGRSLLYLDTSIRTPMNRARTEAFLSGCCVIQVEGAHDLDRWAKPGENIVIVPNNPKVIAKTVANLIENRYEEALAIGQKGKKMAMKFFNPERYRQDWLDLFERVLVNDQ